MSSRALVLACLALATGSDEVSLLQAFLHTGQSPKTGQSVVPSLNHAVHAYPRSPLPYETIGSHNAGMIGSSTEVDSDPLHAYRMVSEELQRTSLNSGTLHSHQIVRFVSTLTHAPRLLPGGCLYLPSDTAWQAFYGTLERPYPPMFAEMVANAFYPDCSRTSVSGVTTEFCEDGSIRGSLGCIKVEFIGIGARVQIFASDGHVGLPLSWNTHFRRKRFQLTASIGSSAAHQLAVVDDECGIDERGELPEVPADVKLRIPTKVVMCISQDRNLQGSAEELIREQIRWTNEGYGGRSGFSKFYWDSEDPPQVDMQIEFDLQKIEIQRDNTCARQTLTDLAYAARYNKDGGRMFTIAIIADDETGVLGMSEFPTEKPETSEMLLVAISTRGVRHWRAFSGEDWDPAYDQGHTMTHEVAHALGVLHTFEGGCSASGDKVPDTASEAYPHYMCQAGESCGSLDPVHNFMDYVPDKCMAGFTEHQKRRAWCILEKYRPILFNESLVKVDTAAE